MNNLTKQFNDLMYIIFNIIYIYYRILIYSWTDFWKSTLKANINTKIYNFTYNNNNNKLII